MAYDSSLEKRIDALLAATSGIEKKKMFGGVCYLLGGNIAFGIWQQSLIVRADPATAGEKLLLEHVRPFDITGRPMKGWLLVDTGAWSDEAALQGWLEIGRQFAGALPVK